MSAGSHRRARSLAAGAVLAGQLAAFGTARAAVRHVVGVRRGRRDHEAARVRAYRDLLVDMGTHRSFGGAAAELRRLRGAVLPASAAAAVAAAVARVEEIERELALSAADRERHPPSGLGGYAPAAGSRRADPLKLYGVRPDLPRAVPPVVGDAIQQVGAVLDEVRLLHTAEIEWSALLFTLWSRAALVSIAPYLTSATAAPVRLEGRGGVAAWSACASFALATATAAPSITAAVMDRGPHGARVRRRLLVAEVPLSLALAYRHPSWTTCVFATGWTNWWQRPEFDWRRLGLFVGALAVTQGAGLARLRVRPARALAEIAGTMGAVFYTGGSYGAMLPLSATVTVEVLLSGGLRQARAARHARRRIAGAASALRAAGEALASSAPADPAVATLSAAAEALERNAAAADRPPDVLWRLVATAYRRSEVPLRDSAAALARRAPAEQRGEEPPAELRTPSYGHGEALRSARLTDQRAARALHDLLVVLLEEADYHGTGPVHVAFAREGGRLVLRVANRVPAVRRAGLRGSGGQAIERLAGRLPGPGNVDVRGDVDGGFVGLRPNPGWFGVQVSCEATLLSPPQTG